MVQPVKRDRRDELYDAYRALPEHLSGEILDGTLYVLPRPAPRHANAASGLQSKLRVRFQDGDGGPGGWWILFEPELQLAPKEPVAPDIAGWRMERMPELPETAYFEVAPDWICEVLSPSTEKLDRDKKLPYYAHHRVRHVWLLDPIDKRLEVHTLDDDGLWREVRIYTGDVAVRAAPFEAIELDLASLWSSPRRG